MRFLLILLLLSYRGIKILAASPLDSTEAAASILATYFCDDDVLKNMTQQIELLKEANLKMLLEMSVLRDITLQICARRIKKNRLKNNYQKVVQKHLIAAQWHIPNTLTRFRFKPFFVYCLKYRDNGSAWTIIQRRRDNSTDFYGEWSEYKLGFGNLQSEFFIGLDKLHALTNAELNELWIELGDFENEKRFAKYKSFAIGNEDEKYALNLLGEYSGDAGDSLKNNQGMKFATKDKLDIAKIYTGAWWFNPKKCESNLNGRYLYGKISYELRGEGVTWQGWHGWEYSLKYAHMAIRPKL